MTVAEALRLALRRLRANKVRSGLTGLGVIIGVAAVVALMAVGQGAQRSLTDRISSLGTNLLSVQAGGATGGFIRGAAGSATTLTTDDADALRSLPYVGAVAPELPVGNALVVSGRSNTTTSMTGTTADEARVRGLEVQAGSFLSAHEQAHGL
ncbi:MAG TPA: ABC transporter permease, partial [Acidimicrobiales bacterium]|nr:ABC transporter permease [Acidimicrobiales bacterium]